MDERSFTVYLRRGNSSLLIEDIVRTAKGRNTMHVMRIKHPYYDAIMAGQKTLEVRVGYDNIKRYQAGELIRLETSQASGTVKIKAVRTYASFEDMLAAEGWQKIAPDAGDTDTALRLIREIYPPEKEALGVYVFEVEPVSS